MPRNRKDNQPFACGRTFCPAAVRVLWAEHGIPVRQMAAPLGVTGTAIRYLATLLGIRDERPRRPVFVYSRKAFIAAWNDKTLTRTQVAERFGMSSCSAGSHAAALGLEKRNGGSLPPVWCKDFGAMWTAGVRTADIATLHRCHASTVHKQAKKEGLPPRPRLYRGIPLSHYRAALAEEVLLQRMTASARTTQLAYEITGREPRRHFDIIKRLAA